MNIVRKDSTITDEACEEMKSKGRIIIIGLGACFGGVEQYLGSLADLISADVSMVVLCVCPELASSLRKANVPLISCAFARSWPKPLQLLIAAAIIVSLRAGRRIDAVWINGYSEILLLPLARLMLCKTIATRHMTFDIPPGPWRRHWKRHVASLIYRLFAFTAHRIICVSDAVAQDMRGLVCDRKLVVIRNWIPNLPRFDNRAHHLSEMRFVFVGRLEEQKGVFLLLEALRKAEERRCDLPHFSLTVVGAGGCESRLRAQAHGCNVTFAGFQGNTSKYYQDADVFINPTLGPEGLPLVSLEAMSYGLPCIFSDIPVHRDVSNDGYAAMLFHCGDVEDLCSRIEFCLRFPDVLSSYGQRARQTIVQNHSACGARMRYLSALFDVCADPKDG